MSKTDLIFCLLGQKISKLSRTEKLLLEIEFFTRVCHELSEIFNARHKEYQQLMKSYLNQEENMFNVKFMQEMMRDILSTEEYSLAGIATHTHIPEEVLSDIATGLNTNPTFELSRKIFELHISVRRSLYDEIIRRIILEYLSPKSEDPL